MNRGLTPASNPSAPAPPIPIPNRCARPPGPPVDATLFVLLSHEMNHVIQQNGIGRPGTSFMGEGLPSAVLSERYHSFGKTYLYSWTARNDAQIPSLARPGR